MSDFRAWLGEAAEEEEEVEEAEAEVAAKTWRIAEEATQEIIEKVQPTTLSELRRKSVIDYVHSLITRSTASQVFPFGSVPLKTYLPDGDIDLTSVCGKNVVEEQLAYEVYSALEREDHNSAAQFVVKDVQLIRAEVKLVKCLVQNIVVDISFNQLGGLSTLCFLEKVDLLIGKDHLFKRSIILIKAWCYYESRILGAHHGLISTYALETLVLYIFHVFHSSLNGPLAALYKFLDYFSKFDWDNYCISLNGPVRLVSLPELIVETPKKGRYDLLLGDDFFKECMETFSVPARAYDANSRSFCPKHLNIVDPLKENNNLGRSVSKGNFYRIKSAFMHGARKLGLILSLPEETVANELRKFFSNTLDRHGSGERPDVQDSIPIDHQFGSVAALTFSGRELNQQDQILYESEASILRGRSGESTGLTAKKSGNVSNFVRMETEDSANRVAVYETCLNGHAVDPTTFGIQDLSMSNDNFDSRASNIEPSKSPRVKEFNVPNFYFSHSTVEDGELGNGNAQCGRPSSSCFTETKLSSGVLLATGEEMTPVECTDVDSNQFLADNEFLSHCETKKHPLYLNSTVQSFKDVYPGYYGSYALITAAGIPEPFYALADLSGDYDNHLKNLHYGRSCYEHAPRAPLHSMSQAFTEQSQVQNYWDVIGQPMHIRKDVIPSLNSNVVQNSQLYSYRRHLLPGTALVADEMTKPRGTGTYLPNMNHYLERVSTTRGRNQGPLRSPRGNGPIITSQETASPERNGCELLKTQVPYHRNGRKAGSFDHRQYRSPEAKSNFHVNGTVQPSEGVVEFGSLGQVPPGTVSMESFKQPKIGYVPVQNSSVSLSTWGSQRSKPVSSLEQDRIDGQSYKLKDDEDFPPLCDSNAKGLSVYAVKSSKC